MSFIIEPGDALFVSKLDKASKQKAEEELHEHEKDRAIAVQSFRSLILQEKWLRTPTDFPFLLRFLRTKKFSQLLAKETLENYWTVKTKYPDWFADLDPGDKTLQEIMRTCFCYSPLKRDKNGRRLMIRQVGSPDMDVVIRSHGVTSVFRVLILISEWLNCDENVQVNGLSTFIDSTNMSMKHQLSLWSKDNRKRMSQYFEQSLPARLKCLYVYNEPPFMDAVWAIVSPLMGDKFKSRFCLHGKSLASVYESLGMEVLPDTYLPDDYTGPKAGSPEQIVEDMIADMMKPEFRNYVITLSSSEYGVDLEEKKSSSKTVASFRQLNID